jgi:DNA polymerase III epsilon subunit family exonuclease
MQQSLFSLLTDEAPSQAAAATQGNPLAGNPFGAFVPLPEQALDGMIFTVMDIETTGLAAKKNSITELTAIQYQWQGGTVKEIGMLSQLVKPTDAISDEIIAITGITEAMVANAPAVRDVLQQFLAFIGQNPILVGHNVGFDIGFIREKLVQSGLSNSLLTAERGVCTRNLARKMLPGLPSYEGIVVATACDVINDNPHRAEADVRMSAGILFHLLGRLGSDVTTLGALQALQGPLKLAS